jgi:hypothetical protein
MKVEEDHAYGSVKDDAEGYIELSEVTVGIFDQSRLDLYSYTKDQVGTIYKVYSDSTQQMADTRTPGTMGQNVKVCPLFSLDKVW